MASSQTSLENDARGWCSSMKDDSSSSSQVVRTDTISPSHNVELLSQLLFSTQHLNHILRDPLETARFHSFLSTHRPRDVRLLSKYIDSQTAAAAVEYANALADRISSGSNAAAIDSTFGHVASEAICTLCNEALPAYVTHRMVQTVTEILVKGITGESVPVLRRLVHGLAEVFCLTDPSLPDNPVIYASEGFFSCTQYSREQVIGRNCRFLQGSKTDSIAATRLTEALDEGQETCEIILNYRRDGSPFVNLLTISPLFDNRGQVRYFLGALVDINGLIEEGRGLESFHSLLQSLKPTAASHASETHSPKRAKSPDIALQELTNLWGPTEYATVHKAGRNRSFTTSSTASSSQNPVTQRIYLGFSDHEEQPRSRGITSPLVSNRVSGVIQNYLLVRPHPSLRITFTSPALRIPGLLQSKFTSRFTASPHIQEGITNALVNGISVTAKVDWITNISSDSSDKSSDPGICSSTKPRWIHCTPLSGNDEEVGVWMIIMVENETITGSLNSKARRVSPSSTSRHHHHHDLPHKDHTRSVSAAASLVTPMYGSTERSISARELHLNYLHRSLRPESTKTGPASNGHINGNSIPRKSSSLRRAASVSSAPDHISHSVSSSMGTRSGRQSPLYTFQEDGSDKSVWGEQEMSLEEKLALSLEDKMILANRLRERALSEATSFNGF